MAEVRRCRTNGGLCRIVGDGCVEGARRSRGRQGGMHGGRLPDRCSDGGNRLTVGVPLLARLAGTLRLGRDHDTGDRADGVRLGRPRAIRAGAQERGQADREKHQATHEVIVTGHGYTVNFRRRSAR